MLIPARVLLVALVTFGLYNSTGLAWRELTLGAACPHVGSVPACYVAFGAYLAMIVGLVWGLVTRARRATQLLYFGVGVAVLLALVGSVLELIIGDICPRAGAVPLCFVSLGMSLLIGALARYVGRGHE